MFALTGTDSTGRDDVSWPDFQDFWRPVRSRFWSTSACVHLPEL